MLERWPSLDVSLSADKTHTSSKEQHRLPFDPVFMLTSAFRKQNNLDNGDKHKPSVLGEVFQNCIRSGRVAPQLLEAFTNSSVRETFGAALCFGQTWQQVQLVLQRWYVWHFSSNDYNQTRFADTCCRIQQFWFFIMSYRSSFQRMNHNLTWNSKLQLRHRPRERRSNLPTDFILSYWSRLRYRSL